MDRRLIGAVLPDRVAAIRAAARLRAEGLGDRGVQSAVWSDNRYVIESHAPRRIGRSLVMGAVIGGAAGAVAGAVIMLLVFPEFPSGLALLVGAIIGSGAGSVWGAYFGIGRHEAELWDEEDWAHIDLDSGHVLLVVEATGTEEREHVIYLLEDAGGTPVEPVRP
jgi:hypothetical protein